MSSDLDLLFDEGARSSSGARSVEVDDVVGSADSSEVVEILEMVEICAVGY